MALTSYNRWQAFAVHFAISLGIFLVLLAVVFGYWYPGVLREADQSWQRVLMLIVGVDLVLGPLLTLIVFNPVKKSLKMDLSIIAIAQISALLAGMYTVHQSRPVGLYLAFPPVGFELMTADQTPPDILQKVMHAESPLFYYQGDLPLGAELKDLAPNNLINTNNPGFKHFLDRHNIEPNKKDESYFIPVASRQDIQIHIDKTGRPIAAIKVTEDYNEAE